MNYSPSLQNDDRGDAAGSGPRSTFQVLASIARSGLSTAIAIAPMHEPPFSKAADRDKWHRENIERERAAERAERNRLRQELSERREAERVAAIEASIFHEGEYVPPLNYSAEEKRALRGLKQTVGGVGRCNHRRATDSFRD